MKESLVKKSILSFVISALIFSLAFLIISLGLSRGRNNDRTNINSQTANFEGESINILLAMNDFSPDKFNDYDPVWVKNVTGKNYSSKTKNRSLLSGGRKVYIENMAILQFDKERGRMAIIPISGSTLVNVKGIQIRLEEIAGQWGIDVLTEKIHAITGISIDKFAVFDPTSAAEAFDLFGDVDYTIKCNMEYKIPERGIDIDLNAGTYRLDGVTTVDMLRFDDYDNTDLTRSDVTIGYAKRLVKKIEQDFTKEELCDIINKISRMSYTNFVPLEMTEQINLMSDCGELVFEAADLCGNWQTVNTVRYFVLDETQTLHKLSKYRSKN